MKQCGCICLIRIQRSSKYHYLCCEYICFVISAFLTNQRQCTWTEWMIENKTNISLCRCFAFWIFIAGYTCTMLRLNNSFIKLEINFPFESRESLLTKHRLHFESGSIVQWRGCTKPFWINAFKLCVPACTSVTTKSSHEIVFAFCGIKWFKKSF